MFTDLRGGPQEPWTPQLLGWRALAGLRWRKITRESFFNRNELMRCLCRGERAAYYPCFVVEGHCVGTSPEERRWNTLRSGVRIALLLPVTFEFKLFPYKKGATRLLK